MSSTILINLYIYIIHEYIVFSGQRLCGKNILCAFNFMNRLTLPGKPFIERKHLHCVRLLFKKSRPGVYIYIYIYILKKVLALAL